MSVISESLSSYAKGMCQWIVGFQGPSPQFSPRWKQRGWGYLAGLRVWGLRGCSCLGFITPWDCSVLGTVCREGRLSANELGLGRAGLGDRGCLLMRPANSTKTPVCPPPSGRGWSLHACAEHHQGDQDPPSTMRTMKLREGGGLPEIPCPDSKLATGSQGARRRKLNAGIIGRNFGNWL